MPRNDSGLLPRLPEVRRRALRLAALRVSRGDPVAEPYRPRIRTWTASLRHRAPLRPAAALFLLLACASAPRPTAPPAGPAAAARDALSRFVAAVDQGQWPEAWSLLSARWRGRETPERLAADLAASGPVGASAVARARAALSAGAQPDVRDGAAALPVGEGRAVALVLEDGSWRVDALE